MSGKNLIICDPEEEYAQALAVYLMQKKELSVQVQVCSSVSQLESLAQETQIHLLFLSEEYRREDRSRIDAEKVFLLYSHRDVKAEEGEILLYKYQPGRQIMAALIKECGFQEKEESIFGTFGRKKTAKVIGIFSPVHRIGKTSYGLRLGEELAASRNVLYLNLELCGGIGGHFEEGEQTLSDVLYYARQEKGNLGLLLTTVVRHRKKLDYILPMSVAEDMKSIRAEEWTELIRRILEESIYEVLILDIDEGLQEVLKVLNICTEIHMLWRKDRYSEAKIRQFEKEAGLLGYEKVLKKIIRKECHDRGGTTSCKDS